MKKILISGASGFIGKNLIKKLVKSKVKIATLDRSSTLKIENVKTYLGDICNYSFVKKTILDFNPNIVFHLAGYKNRSSSVLDIGLSLDVNLIGTLNIYRALLKLPYLEKVISLGTTDEYGKSNSSFKESSIERPISPYGFSKLCSTHLAKFFYRSYGLSVVVLRPTIAYGPYQANDMFIPSLINSLISNKDFKMTKGNQLRDFIYISDLVDIILKISESNKYNGEVFNVGSGKSLKIREIALAIAKDLNKEHLLKLGSIPYRKNEVMKYTTSTNKIKKAFAWTPKVSFKKGIRLTIKHYENNE